MYCIKCGVELSQGQAICPICETRVCHPDFPVDPDAAPYPRKDSVSEEYNRKGILFVITILTALVAVLMFILDISMMGRVSFSGYASGALALAYIWVFLPLWFRKATPVIFTPCGFAAATLYLLYINLATGGDWFLSFAFPISGGLCIIVTAMVTLCRYVRKGYLYIIGGGLIALGGLTVLIEFLLYVTFSVGGGVLWSPFSAVTLTVFGLMLIVIAIVKPLKESLRKIFFLG